MKPTPIDTMKNLLDELIMTKAYLSKIQKRLKQIDGNLDYVDEWEDLYAREFELTVKLSGVYYDIQKLAKRNRNDSNDFMIRRIQKEADKIFKPLVIQL